MYFNKKDKLLYQSVCVGLPCTWFVFSWHWSSRKALLQLGALASSRSVY